jgi:hypothetical protein
MNARSTSASSPAAVEPATTTVRPGASANLERSAASETDGAGVELHVPGDDDPALGHAQGGEALGLRSTRRTDRGQVPKRRPVQRREEAVAESRSGARRALTRHAGTPAPPPRRGGSARSRSPRGRRLRADRRERGRCTPRKSSGRKNDASSAGGPGAWPARPRDRRGDHGHPGAKAPGLARQGPDDPGLADRRPVDPEGPRRDRGEAAAEPLVALQGGLGGAPGPDSVEIRGAAERDERRVVEELHRCGCTTAGPSLPWPPSRPDPIFAPVPRQECAWPRSRKSAAPGWSTCCWRVLLRRARPSGLRRVEADRRQPRGAEDVPPGAPAPHGLDGGPGRGHPRRGAARPARAALLGGRAERPPRGAPSRARCSRSSTGSPTSAWSI